MLTSVIFILRLEVRKLSGRIKSYALRVRRKLFCWHTAQQGGVILTILFIVASAVAGYFAYRFVDSAINPSDESAFEEGSQEVRTYDGWGCWWSTEEYEKQSQWNNTGNVFTADKTMIVTNLMMYAGECGTSSKEWVVKFYTWDDVAEDKDEYIGSSLPFGTDELESWCWGQGELPICNVAFNDAEEYQVLLAEGTDYVYYIEEYKAGSASVWLYIRTTGNCVQDYIIGAVHGGNYYDGYTYEYWLTGYRVQEPTVVTLGAEIRGDGSVWLSGWVDIIGDMSTGFLISEVEAQVEAGAGVIYECNESTGTSQSRVSFEQRIVSILTDVKYYYCAYAEYQGTYWYGDVLDFTRLELDILPVLEVDVIEATMNVVEFETAFIGVPSGTSWNISIHYGQCEADFLSEAFNVTVASTVTADGVWYTEVPPTEFDAGYSYLYRAKAIESGSTTVYSDIMSFVMYDSSQPRWMNWIAQETGWGFTWMWWIIAGLAFIIVWALAGWTRWWWLGAVGTAIVCVALISFGYVSAWVVVLLAIVCGWIIFKIVWQKAGAGGNG